MSQSTTAKRVGGRVLMYLALAGYLVFLGFPLLWLVSAAFKSSAELNSLSANLIPQEWVFTNFTNALERQNLIPAAINSLVVSIATMVITMLLTMPMAYALARLQGRLRAAGTVWILGSQVFPSILIIIPLFLVMRTLHLNDSLFGLVLVYVTFTMPFTLWMMQGYVAAIPRELEEAGEMDGAGRWQVLRTIVFPLLVPGARRDRDVHVRVGVERVLPRARAHPEPGALHAPDRAAIVPRRGGADPARAARRRRRARDHPVAHHLRPPAAASHRRDPRRCREGLRRRPPPCTRHPTQENSTTPRERQSP